jgi:hypothetical protein
VTVVATFLPVLDVRSSTNFDCPRRHQRACGVLGAQRRYFQFDGDFLQF